MCVLSAAYWADRCLDVVAWIMGGLKQIWGPVFCLVRRLRNHTVLSSSPYLHELTSLFFSPHPPSPSQGKPVEILPFLYLGSAYHASRQDYLSDLHITALLNVSRRDLQPAKGHYDYKWIPVEDSHMADISSHFQEAIEFIGELKGMNVVPGSPVCGVQLFNSILIVRGYTRGFVSESEL